MLFRSVGSLSIGKGGTENSRTACVVSGTFHSGNTSLRFPPRESECGVSFKKWEFIGDLMQKLRVLVSLTTNDNDYQIEQAHAAEAVARK